MLESSPQHHFNISPSLNFLALLFSSPSSTVAIWKEYKIPLLFHSTHSALTLAHIFIMEESLYTIFWLCSSWCFLEFFYLCFTQFFGSSLILTVKKSINENGSSWLFPVMTKIIRYFHVELLEANLFTRKRIFILHKNALFNEFPRCIWEGARVALLGKKFAVVWISPPSREKPLWKFPLFCFLWRRFVWRRRCESKPGWEGMFHIDEMNTLPPLRFLVLLHTFLS